MKAVLVKVYMPNTLSIRIVEFSKSVWYSFAAILFVSLAVECTLSFSNVSYTNSTVVVVNSSIELKVNSYREDLERSPNNVLDSNSSQNTQYHLLGSSGTTVGLSHPRVSYEIATIIS